MQFADNAGPKQPVHKRMLIRAFVGHLENQYIVHVVNRECSDQTACMYMLIWTYTVCKLYEGFLVCCTSFVNVL